MKNIGSYPKVRLRRNRKTEWSRRLVSENSLSTNDLIWPIFIREGKNIKETLVFANTTAGLSTTKIGTANSMPNRDEIEKSL